MKYCIDCRYYDLVKNRCMGDKFTPKIHELSTCDKWKLKKVRVYLRRKRK